MELSYGDVIYYKEQADSPDKLIPTKKVRSISTEYKNVYNIKFGKQQRMMTLLVKGKMNLYVYIVLDEAGGGNLTTQYMPTLTYVINQEDSYEEVKKGRYKKTLSSRLADCPVLISKILRKRGYKFEDMEKIIKEYNSCE